jgi:MYXO-CTERM domain-containing protein
MAGRKAIWDDFSIIFAYRLRGGKVKPKASKRISGILAAVIVFIFFQLAFAPSSSGALYNWPAAIGEGGSLTGGGITLSGIDMSASELSQNHGIFGDATLTMKNTAFTGWGLAASVAVFSSDAATHGLQWRGESTNFPGGPGTRTGATSNIRGILEEKTNPLATVGPAPNSAWLLASGILALFLLRRRKPTA